MSSDSIYNNNFDYDYNDDDDISTFETDSTMIILGIFCFILFTLLCMHTYGLRRRQRTRINHSNHSNRSIQLNSISFNPTFVYTPEICTICLEPFNDEKDMTKLSCNHYFHIDCIAHWFNENHLTCPFCNNNINEDI